MQTKLLRLILIACGLIGLVSLIRFELPGLWPDEAHNGVDAYRVSSGQQAWGVYYGTNNGREGLHIGILALVFEVFGPSIEALRNTSKAIGVLSIGSIIWLCVEVARVLKPKKSSVDVALVAFAITATSHWLYYFSSIGFRAMLLVLTTSLAMASFLRLRQSSDKKWAIITGLLLGLSLYTYLPIRPLLPLMLVVVNMWLMREKSKNHISSDLLKITLYAAITTALPLLVYFVFNPSDIFLRGAQVSELGTENPIVGLLKSAISLVLMFFIDGDPNPRHNFMSWPQLAWGVMPLFAAGFYWLIMRIKSDGRSSFAFVVISSLALGLLPALVSDSSENPHALRSIAALPAVMVVCTIGSLTLLETGPNRTIKGFAPALLGLLMMASSYQAMILPQKVINDEQTAQAFRANDLRRAQDAVALIDSGQGFYIKTNDDPEGFSLAVAQFQFAVSGYDLNSYDLLACEDPAPEGRRQVLLDESCEV